MQRARGCEERIHDALENLIAVTIQNGRVRHEVTDVAHEHEAATREAEALAAG